MKLDEIGISKHYIATVFPQRPASGAKWCWGSLEPHSYSAMSSCSCSELLSPSLASGRCWGRSMRAGCQHTFSTHRSLSTTHLFFFFAGLCQTFSKIAPLIWSLLETKQQKNQPSLVLVARIALRGSVTLLEKCWGVTAEGALLVHKEMPALRGQSAFQEQSWGGSLCVLPLHGVCAPTWTDMLKVGVALPKLFSVAVKQT